MKKSKLKMAAVRLALVLALGGTVVQPTHAETTIGAGNWRPPDVVSPSSLWSSIVSWFYSPDQNEQGQSPQLAAAGNDGGCPPWVCSSPRPEPK